MFHFTLFHSIPQGKRERPVGQKGKGKGTDSTFGAWISLGIQTARARTHDTKRFPGWTHLDSLDLLDHTREKGRPPTPQREKGKAPGGKGKRENVEHEVLAPFPPSIPFARTHARHETISRFGGACLKADSLPPTSDLYTFVH